MRHHCWEWIHGTQKTIVTFLSNKLINVIITAALTCKRVSALQSKSQVAVSAHLTSLLLFCLQTCGQEGKPCCYSSDATDQDARCLSGLTCVAEGVNTYSSFRMYVTLAADPTQTANAKLMGTCRWEAGGGGGEQGRGKGGG